MRKDWEMTEGDCFGRLTVIERDYEKEQDRRMENRPEVPYYRCQCSCGNTITVSAHSLRYGNTQSCGCLQKERAHENNHRKDLNGMIFDELVVVEIDQDNPGESKKHTKWLCRCSLCGKIGSYRGSDLLSGRASCKCQTSKRISNIKTIDLTGRKFGHLFVIERDTSISPKGGRHAKWICRCDNCGRTESVSATMLLQYGKDRCRHCGQLSLGEAKIIDILDEANIQYAHDMTYGDCVFPESGGRLRFDFCVESDRDNIPIYMIEYDGEQHYKPAPGWDSSEEAVVERRKRDEFKNGWCKEHNIPLIRIPYTRKDKLCLGDLMLETTQYRVV